MTRPPLRLVAALMAALAGPVLLAGCAATPELEAPPPTVPGYEAVEDGGFTIPAVNPRFLSGDNRQALVTYEGSEAPGTVVVDVYSRKLYLVQDGGTAIRYAIAVGREGTSFRGSGYVGRKAKWPSWAPTANMIRTRPDLYAQYAGGLRGGLENPLGARALYLYRNGRDTMFRIHGTNDPASIGRATSAGCIRLFNQDAIDLFERVGTGARVKVRTREQSLAADGEWMDDAWGRIVPVTPETIAEKAADEAAIAEYHAQEEARIAAGGEAARLAEEQADAARVQRCANEGIAPENCPTAELEALAARIRGHGSGH